MLKNIWRYSHLTLAVLSSLFVLIASLTGIILALEPIDDELQYISSQEEVALQTTIDSLLARYELIIDISRTDAGHIMASISSDTIDGQYVINPQNGEIIDKAPTKRKLFSFATNLHRSLFLKSTGRALVGIASFLLFLIAVSGLLLLVKRQQGWRQALGHIVKDDIYQYWHVVTGRLQFMPIIIITLSGVYLSLLRFDIIKAEVPEVIEYEVDDESLSKVGIFTSTTTQEMTLLEFPFSEDEMDYFYLTLPDRRLGIHQYSGAIVEEERFDIISQVTPWMYFLHTGRGSILWSIILLIAAVNIIYFMYSGVSISIRRLSFSIKNKVAAIDAEYVILYGSENGGTKQMAGLFLKALQEAKLSVFAGSLNSYQLYPNAKSLVVMTSTYGIGEAPSNASNFFRRLQDVDQQQDLDFAVLGFGSLAYPDFCQFAIDIQDSLTAHEGFDSITPLTLINNQSFVDFKSWVRKWENDHNMSLEITTAPKVKLPQLREYAIIDREHVETDFEDTYTITLRPKKKEKWTSGDLLAIYPEVDRIERLYSIGSDRSGDILLSIKRHEYGICSNMLLKAAIGTSIHAHLRRNREFHLPKSAVGVIFIANGTGIAPFLGMMHAHTKFSKHLYWGGRTCQGYSLYKEMIDSAICGGTLQSIHTAFSKEKNSESLYVQDLLDRDIDMITQMLQRGAVIMLCGSLAMQAGVFSLLDDALSNSGSLSLDKLKKTGKILSDCY